jgi:hypothetical protein
MHENSRSHIIGAMRSFILSLPAKLQPAVIIGSTVVAAFVISLVTRACFNEQQLAIDNDWITSVYGTLGTLYSVLIAFVVAGVWQNFRDAEAAVNTEANALTDLVFLIRYISTAKTAHVREATKSYVASVVERWDLLELATRVNRPVGEINLATSNALLNAILNVQPQGERELELYAQTLDLTGIWLDARRNRLRSAKGNTASALWGLLIAGAFVLFAFHGLFVTHGWAVWVVLLLGFSLIVGLSFYLIFSLDSPFSGRLSAGPEPFTWLLQDFERTDGLGI